MLIIHLHEKSYSDKHLPFWDSTTVDFSSISPFIQLWKCFNQWIHKCPWWKLLQSLTCTFRLMYDLTSTYYHCQNCMNQHFLFIKQWKERLLLLKPKLFTIHPKPPAGWCQQFLKCKWINWLAILFKNDNNCSMQQLLEVTSSSNLEEKAVVFLLFQNEMKQIFKLRWTKEIFELVFLVTKVSRLNGWLVTVSIVVW